MTLFKLDSQLAADGVFLRDLTLSRLLLMNDQRFPWLILVPRRSQVTEVFELSPQDQQQLMAEVALVSNMLKKMFKVQKINIGALGNIVSQLHVHIVGRQSTDSLWPQPVWGRGPGVVYDHDQLVILKRDFEDFLDSVKPR